MLLDLARQAWALHAEIPSWGSKGWFHKLECSFSSAAQSGARQIALVGAPGPGFVLSKGPWRLNARSWCGAQASLNSSTALAWPPRPCRLQRYARQERRQKGAP